MTHLDFRAPMLISITSLNTGMISPLKHVALFVSRQSNTHRRMNLSEHLKQEELDRLKLAWRSLTPLQRKVIRLRIAFASFPRRALAALDQYIYTRRARYAYAYRAHWL